MTDSGIIHQASIGGFEQAFGSKPRALGIEIVGKLATSGASFVFGDGNGVTTSGSANSQTAAISFGAGSVTLSGTVSGGVIAGEWVIGDNRLIRYDDGAGNLVDPDGTVIAGSGSYVVSTDDSLDVFMTDGDFSSQTTNGANTGSAYSPLKVVSDGTAATQASPAVYTTATAHGFAAHDKIIIAGASNVLHNGEKIIASVTDTTFTLTTNVGSGGASTTFTARPMISGGTLSITSINGGTVSFQIINNHEDTQDLSLGDSYRLSLRAYARGGV